MPADLAGCHTKDEQLGKEVTTMILDKIYTEKRRQLVLEKEQVPLGQLEKKVQKREEKNRFSRAMTAHPHLAIIGEVKKASPSKGLIREDFDAPSIVKEYDESGVDALSILTESAFFQGNKDYIPMAKTITNKPILRKDFILDPYQVVESNVLGADALLLIVAGLEQELLCRLMEMTKELGMEALVEVHKEEELIRALDAGAGIIGINNRDLHTFKVDLKTTEELMAKMPKGIVTISESGIENAEQMDHILSLGVDGVLIGESFMRAKSIREHEDMLRGRP